MSVHLPAADLLEGIPELLQMGTFQLTGMSSDTSMCLFSLVDFLGTLLNLLWSYRVSFKMETKVWRCCTLRHKRKESSWMEIST